jgi:hypothetical protein
MAGATLVTVHGFWSSPATWDRLSAVWQADRDLQDLHIHGFGYPSARKPRLPLSPTRIPDFDDLAQMLASEYVTRLGRDSPVAFVTHSQGGLVLQRFLAWMTSEGRARELTRIRTVIMLACPNGGSQYLASIRRAAGYGRHPQAASLEVLNRQVADTQRAVMARIVHAAGTDDHRCPIPFHVYAAGSDAIVTAASAQATFPGAGTLAGDHFTILNPATPGNTTAGIVKHHLLTDLAEKPPALTREAAPTEAAGPGRSTVNLSGTQGVQVGDHNIQHNVFPAPSASALALRTAGTDEATKELARIERDREHDRKRPVLEGHVLPWPGRSDGRGHRLEIRVKTHWPLTLIVLSVPGGAWFGPSVHMPSAGMDYLIQFPEPGRTAATFRPGHPASCPVRVADDARGTVTAFAKCRNEHGLTWEDIEVPIALEDTGPGPVPSAAQEATGLVSDLPGDLLPEGSPIVLRGGPADGREVLHASHPGDYTATAGEVRHLWRHTDPQAWAPPDRTRPVYDYIGPVITSGEHEVRPQPKAGLEIVIEDEKQTPFPGAATVLEIEFRVTNHDPVPHLLRTSIRGLHRASFPPPDDQALVAARGEEHAIRERRRRNGDGLPPRIRPGETVRGVYVTAFPWDPAGTLSDYTLVIKDERKTYTARPHGAGEDPLAAWPIT